MAADAEDSGTTRMKADASRLAIRVIFSLPFVAGDHTQIYEAAPVDAGTPSTSLHDCRRARFNRSGGRSTEGQ
jgi:hypothetical protein